MKSGFISLFNKKGKEIVSRKYFNPNDRDRIIAGWKYTYGKLFLTMFYQISPNVSEERFDEDELQKMVWLYGKGVSYREIGRQFGCTAPTAAKYINRYKHLKAA
jgi:hypothetical protein